METRYIAKGKNVYKVLSIGFGNTGTPMVTIESGRETVCYKLPYEYSEWAMTVVGFTNMGEKLGGYYETGDCKFLQVNEYGIVLVGYADWLWKNI